MSCFRIAPLLLVLCSAIVTTTPVRADLLTQNPSAGELKMPAGTVGKLATELNLSADQVQRLKKMRLESKGKTKERRLALRTAKQELAQLMHGNASSSQIRQKRQQVQSLQREISDLNFENTLAIREMLTPDQRVKLQQLMQQRRQNRGKLK